MSDPVDQYLKGRIREAFCNYMLLLLLLVLMTIVMTMVMIVFYEGATGCSLSPPDDEMTTGKQGLYHTFFWTFLRLFCADFITRPKSDFSVHFLCWFYYKA